MRCSRCRRSYFYFYLFFFHLFFFLFSSSCASSCSLTLDEITRPPWAPVDATQRYTHIAYIFIHKYVYNVCMQHLTWISRFSYFFRLLLLTPFVRYNDGPHLRDRNLSIAPAPHRIIHLHFTIFHVESTATCFSSIFLPLFFFFYRESTRKCLGSM